MWPGLPWWQGAAWTQPLGQCGRAYLDYRVQPEHSLWVSVAGPTLMPGCSLNTAFGSVWPGLPWWQGAAWTQPLGQCGRAYLDDRVQPELSLWVSVAGPTLITGCSLNTAFGSVWPGLPWWQGAAWTQPLGQCGRAYLDDRVQPEHSLWVSVCSCRPGRITAILLIPYH